MMISRSSPGTGGGEVSAWRMAIASVLLVGVLVLAYGYFEQNSIALYIGLAVVVGGVLNGLVRLLTQQKY